MAEMGDIIKVRVGDGELVPLVDLVEFWSERMIAEKRTAGCFLVVGDPDKPSTWRLPVRNAENEKPDHNLMGAAWAALHSGYRGNKYEGPDKDEALRKLIALYKEEDMPLPTAEQEDFADVSVSEVEDGAVLMFGEGAANNYSGPVVMDVALIEPGFGNSKDNHYYPREMLRRSAEKFQGVKMYLTNHVDSEHTVRNEVAEVLKCPVRFTDSGAPVARVGVFDADFAASIRNRAQLGTLNNLQCSILGNGKVKRDAVEEGGRKGHLVEDIVDIKSIDWVPRAGAGGRVLNLVEMKVEGDKMPNPNDKNDKVEEKEEEQKTTIEEIREQKKEPVALDSSVVLPLLMESGLPDKTLGRLAKRQYFEVAEVEDAIAEVREVLAEIQEAGRPKNMGASSGDVEPKQPQTAEEVAEAERDILRRHGLIQ